MEPKPPFSDEYLWERETVIPDFDVSKFARETTKAFASPDGDPTVRVPRSVVERLRAESSDPVVIMRKALVLALMVSLGTSVMGCWHHHRVRAGNDVQQTAPVQSSRVM